MSQINVRNLSNENDDGSPEIVGVSTFSATSFFVPPKGSTAERPSECEPGSIRFNTDTSNLEYYRGKTLGWSQFELVTPNLGGGTGSNTGLGVRAILPGGNSSPAKSASISFLTISTLGNTQDFGDLSVGNNANAGASSRTRAISFGGSLPPRTNTIELMTFASLGDAANFGDMTVARAELGSTSNNVRGIAAGGSPGPKDELDYITIAQTGNSVDYGDLAVAREGLGQGCISNGTRGIFCGGNSPTFLNNIEFVTIMTTGNTSDFGDLSFTNTRQANVCSSTRGLFAGGYSSLSPAIINNIEFITIATTGNSADFGDLTRTSSDTGGASSPTRGVFAGGRPGPNAVNTIDFVEIATLGNAVDFGDTDVAGATNGIIRPTGTSSNGHGGL